MTARAKISIVTGGPLCRNPRALKEAHTLGAAGHEVSVFTVAHRATYEEIDAELVARAPFRKIPLRIRATTGGAALLSFAARSATWAARRMARYGVQSDRAFGPVDALAHLAKRHPADLTIVHTELGLAVGRRLAAQGRRVAADFEDWHSRDLLPEAQQNRPRRLLQRLEHEMLNRSTFTVTTSDALADALSTHYGAPRPVVIRNAFPLQTLPPRAEGRPLTFFWFSQTIGPGRGLEEFIAAWSLMTAPARLCLLGEPVPGYCDALAQLVPTPRRSDLEFLPVVSPTELPGLIARHDVGLALEQTEPPSRHLTVTNKILQYLNAGLAVLATPTAGQREIAGQSDGGIQLIRLDDPRGLACTLDDLVGDAERVEAMRAGSRRAAVRCFCWEREEPKLLAVVDRALRSGGAPLGE